MGEATLICKTTEVSFSDVDVVRWYIHDTLTPLYAFPVSERNNNIQAAVTCNVMTIVK